MRFSKLNNAFKAIVKSKRVSHITNGRMNEKYISDRDKIYSLFIRFLKEIFEKKLNGCTSKYKPLVKYCCLITT